MNRVVARVKKLKMRSLAHVENHNKRIDIDSERSPNIKLDGHDEVIYSKYNCDLATSIQNRIDEIPTDRRTKIVTSGKNETTVAVEIVLSASPGYFRENPDEAYTYDEEKTRAWIDANLKLLKEEYGENLIEVDAHLSSEKTPHLHAIITPLQVQERKHRRTKKQIANDAKSSTYTVETFNAKGMFNREGLIRFQDITAEAVRHLGIERGVRKLKLEEYTLQDFYSDIQRDSNFSLKRAKKEIKKIIIGEPPIMNRKQYQEDTQKEIDESREHNINFVSRLIKTISHFKREYERYKAIAEKFANFFDMSVEDLDNKIDELNNNAIDINNENKALKEENDKERSRTKYAKMETDLMRKDLDKAQAKIFELENPEIKEEIRDELERRNRSKYDQSFVFNK